MTERRANLGDFAHVFHGVGNAAIFTKQKLEGANNKPDANECGVIRAADVTSQRPWYEPESISRAYVARRITESNKRRGLGQSCLLRPGDVLVSTRGIPKVSPAITHEIVQGGAVVAGPEIIVIRAKDNVHPAALRRALKSEATKDYFARNTTRKNQDKKSGEGWDKSGVLSKEAVLRLPIPADIEAWKPRFEEDAEVLSHKAEDHLSAIGPLSHAIIELARWRLETGDQKEIRRFDAKLTNEFSWSKKIRERESEINMRRNAEVDKVHQNWAKDLSQTEPNWEWDAPFRRERDKLFVEKITWMADGISHCLDQVAEGRCTDEDTALLCRLLVGKPDPAAARHALVEQPGLVESMTMEVHQGDERASSVNVPRSVRQLLASFVGPSNHVAIPSAETGHLAFEALLGQVAPSRLTLIEGSAPYRKVARSLCGLARQDAQIESYEYQHTAPWNDVDVALLEASTVPLKYGETEFSTSELISMDQKKALGIAKHVMPWSNLASMKPGSFMVAYIPTDRWRLLLPVRTQISALLQLPPLSKPAWSKKQEGKYATCDQGLLVLLRGGMMSADRAMKVIDATLLNKGASATELTSEQIKLIRDMLLGRDSSAECAPVYHISHDRIPKEMSIWPGMLSLTGRRFGVNEASQQYSLETLVEEFKYRHHCWKQTQTETFSEIGILPGF